MSETPPYLRHLSSADDLVTTYEETRAGFIALALEKNEQASPFIAQARHLRQTASLASKPEDLVGMRKIRSAVLKASGLSDKAENHLEERDRDESVKNLIEKFLKPAGAAFVEELVYRFLLTRGDTLGGIMRSIEGRWGQTKFAEMLVAALKNAGIHYDVFVSSSGNRLTHSTGVANMNEARAISWERNSNGRTLLFNSRVRIVRKNVDAILYDIFPATNPQIKEQPPQRFLALGELKGGIDPAGADEHWKTGNSALNRIRAAFSSRHLTPSTFFVAAAIETAMAEEIWSQLKGGVLGNAANLNKDSHMASLSNWIISF